MERPVVLLAEDEDSLREIYSIALSSRGFNVLIAKNGTEVLEKLKNNQAEIKLLILDIVMPEMDGFDTLKKIRSDKKYNDMAIVMSTSLNQASDREEALELGADEYLVKTERDPMDFAKHIWDYCFSEKGKKV